MRQIPTNRTFYDLDGEPYTSISHGKDNRNILIILLDSKGNKVNIQYNGISCSQAVINGFAFKEFKSKLKWFKTKTWDNKTCWGSKYPSKLYFVKTNKEADKAGYRDFPEEANHPNFVFNMKTFKYDGVNDKGQTWQEIMELDGLDKCRIIDPYCIDAESILNSILKEIRIKTKINFEFDGFNTNYEEGWSEAYVSLKFKDKKYLLTWQNCD